MKTVILRTLLVCTAAWLLPAELVAGDAPEARGAELLKPFKQNLKSALLDGMEQGVSEAVRVCRDKAPDIAESLSVDGVQMGRSSHRLRNPDNAAPSWVRSVLNAYLAADADRRPKTLELANGRTGYVEPILLQPMCLACHGETLSDDVKTTLNDLYPHDEATGFRIGDLRGVFWVEYADGARASYDD